MRKVMTYVTEMVNGHLVIDESREAHFHCFMSKTSVSSWGQAENIVVAVIEFDDGSISTLPVNQIKFIDKP